MSSIYRNTSPADDDEWGFGDDGADSFQTLPDASDLKHQMHTGLQAHLYKSLSQDDDDASMPSWLHLPLSFTPPPTVSPVLDDVCAASPPPPPPPPPPPAPAPPASIAMTHVQPLAQPLASYIAQAPPGLYLYAEPTSPAVRQAYYNSYGYTPYLPEEVYARAGAPPPAPSPVFNGAPLMSQIPNPFASAHGVNLRKIAADRRARGPDGRFLSQEELERMERERERKEKEKERRKEKKQKERQKKAEKKSLKSKSHSKLHQNAASPTIIGSPGLPVSPEMLEAHLATLQYELAQSREESLRLRQQLHETQTELAELKFSTEVSHIPSYSNKRLRPTSGRAPSSLELSETLADDW